MGTNTPTMMGSWGPEEAKTARAKPEPDATDEDLRRIVRNARKRRAPTAGFRTYRQARTYLHRHGLLPRLV